MPSGSRRHRARRHISAENKDPKQRDQETIRLINQALDKDPVDRLLLRRLAVVRGLVNDKLRAKVWPILLGIESDFDPEQYSSWKGGEHRDSTIVSCDVQRSLWSFTEGWDDEEREAKRQELSAILTAVVCEHGGDVFYYQGLHDIAAVLLFTAGERPAFQMLSSLAACQLRDCTRPSLDAVLELLQLLMPLLSQSDTELHRHIDESGIPPFFALSWFITWFAHNVPHLDQISRIFDALLASHPLMPLYLSAAVMQSWRETILGQEDPSELHRTLTNLPILGPKPLDSLLVEAYRLFKDYPPHKLLALSRLRMHSATSAEAKMEHDRWIMPEKPLSKTGLIPRDALSWLTSRKGVELERGKILKQSTRGVAIGGLVLLSSIAAMYASRALQ